MEILGINGWEMLVLAFLGVLILGPDRLPEYAAKLARLVRRAREMAEGAKGQLKEQLGPEYDDINWRQYDPRQYDPRRIVREALAEPIQDAWNMGAPERPEEIDALEEVDEPEEVYAGSYVDPTVWDPARPTPYDDDAT